MARPAREWQLSLDVGGAADLPMFLRIARAIAADARSGRLPPGARLPGSRELAKSLRVHRNTVLAAYRELAAEGFLESAQGRGTFIQTTLPQVKPRRLPLDPRGQRAPRTRFAFDTAPLEPFSPPPAGALTLYGGVPDTRLLPRELFARAYRRALRSPRDPLAYGDPQGEPRLREAVAGMLRETRALPVTAADVLITRGSQMALSLLGRVLVRPTDTVAVEAYGYQPAWRALSASGARLSPVRVDAQGLVVSELAALCEREPIRAVYVTPHHQYPTTVTMSAARRMALLQLARERRFAVIEDDYDHEFHYEGRPILPLASADDFGSVVYIGTFSKVVAPGLRLGYLVAHESVRKAALALRFDVDRQGDRPSELAVAELMEDGELQRHVWRARRIYAARREHFVHALRDKLGETLRFEVPHGGMALWAHVHRIVPVAAFHAESKARGVYFQPGSLFTFGGRDVQRVRFGYGCLDERELARATSRLRDAARVARRA